MNKVELELFCFNAKTDYLPHFKKLTRSVDSNSTILQLLQTIHQDIEFGFLQSDLFCLKLNGIGVLGGDRLNTVVSFENTITTIKLEPISSYRATLDLIIDTQDFMTKFEPFKKYDTDGSLKSFYISKMLEYYASTTLLFHKEYIGEAALHTAFKLIQEQPHLTNELLLILADEENGIWYHTSLSQYIIDASVNESVFTTLYELVTGKHTNKHFPQTVVFGTQQSFKDFNIGYYGIDDSIQASIKRLDATPIVLESRYQDIAIHSNKKDFTHKIVGKILLEAVDANCDFLLIDDESLLHIFDAQQTQIANLVGRDINLPIVTKQQLSKLSSGIKETKQLGFDTHKIKINFI